MDSLAQDLRFAVRQLIRQRGFAAVVIATLALAIGVNTLTFSFVNFFVFRPLPMKEVARLVLIWAQHPESRRDRGQVSYPDFAEWRAQTTSFEDLAAGGRRTYNLTGAGDPRRLRGFAVTASLFTEWGLQTVAGRTMQPGDEHPGAPRVALLSHGFWSREFGSDATVVGRMLRLDGHPHVVVGVLTPSIELGTLSEIDVWTPLALEANPTDRTARNLLVTGRLKHGVPLSRAAAEIGAITQRQSRENPDTNTGWTALVQPIRSGMTGANSWVILSLMGVAVSLVLAIACANVANLMLARGTGRQRETALRTALGARRARIVRLLLTEGLLLAVVGGALGLVLASWGLDFIRSVTFEPFFALVTVDRRVLAFTTGVSLLAPLLFGLVPALQATRVDLLAALKEGGGSIGATRRGVRGRNLLVAGQLALALALLLVAGLVVRSAIAMRQLQFGFDQRQLLMLRAELPDARYADDAQIRAFVAGLETGLRALPGVAGTTVSGGRPVLDPGRTEALTVEGRPWPNEQARPLAIETVVGSGYFEALRIPIVSGRALGAQDVPGAEAAVVVNQALVRRHFAGQDPLGRHIRIGADPTPRTIVGVAADVLNTEPDVPTAPQAYLPFGQRPLRAFTIFLRTEASDATVAAVRREVARLDPDQPLYDVKTMEQALFESAASDRVIMGMFILFASVALGMGILGLYSLISYLVSQRMREMGVRVALGATRSDILRLVLTRGAGLVAAGVVLGLPVGLGLARVMAGVLNGVSPTDAVTFTLVPAILGTVGLLATAVPARRASRVAPATALRAE
jgi:predicted permease